MDKRILIGGGLVAAIAVGIALATRGAKGAAAPAADAFYPDLPKWRRDMLACVFGHVQDGTLYQWGGGHGHGGDYGVDCSGLVNVCSQQAGMRVGGNADFFYRDLPPVAEPLPGDLALYGTPQRATHVRVVTAWHPDELRAEAIGAEGGGPSVTTPEAAVQQNARVRHVDDHSKFVSQFLGFRSMDPYGATAGLSSAPVEPSPPS